MTDRRAGFANKVTKGVPSSGLMNDKRANERLRRTVEWRTPTSTEQKAFEAHRTLKTYADFLVAAVETDDESWILMERVWHGFPDPPRWIFIAFGPDGRTICGGDFDHIPTNWTMPEGAILALEETV
ncbi:hypothetical protein DSM05_03935 [Pseudomonas sp. FW305-3-2-15-E-TSA4]|jgi:hypothetical protein|nr:hypothetical protein [Pseudomonas sp. FW305-3-2-15-E-TSA4]